jgi:hypothetical protein
LLTFANHLCDGGVFHGIFQGYFSTQHLVPHLDSNKIIISKLCPATQEDQNLLDRWNCTHGIGHGLTDLYDYNTTTAVVRCNDLTVDWEQISCAKGVFMENNVHFIQTGQSDFNNSDIYYPCDKTVKKFGPECYIYHAEYLVIKNKQNVSASFEQCDGISSELAKFCYHGVGRALSVKSYRNIEQGIANCYIGKKSSIHVDCLVGLERAILKLRTSTDAGFELCGASGPDFKPQCYDIAGQWIKLLHPDQQQEWERECPKAHDVQYVASCMNANPETWIEEH